MTNESIDAIYNMRDRIDALFPEDDKHIGAGMRLILCLVERENLFDCQVRRILDPIGELVGRIEQDAREEAALDEYVSRMEAEALGA